MREAPTHGNEDVPVDRRITRRKFVRGAAGLGAATLASPFISKEWAFARSRPAKPTPIEHIIIACQENRSFDHYFGYAPWVGSFGPPPGYTQPDGNGGSVSLYEFTQLSTQDIGHSWSAVHGEIEAGRWTGSTRSTASGR